MPGKKLFRGLGVLACMFFGGTVSASDAPKQTVEGAQAFLAQVLPGQEYMPGSFTELFDSIKRQHRMSGASLYGSGRIYEVSTVRRCVSTLRYDLSPVEMGYRGERMNFVRNYAPNLARGGLPEGFSWGDIVQVEKGGTQQVRITFKENRYASVIYLNSENLANRVAYAIEFLRLRCDETAKTGF